MFACLRTVDGCLNGTLRFREVFRLPVGRGFSWASEHPHTGYQPYFFETNFNCDGFYIQFNAVECQPRGGTRGSNGG